MKCSLRINLVRMLRVNDFFINYRNKKCTYWSNNPSILVTMYLGHGGLYPFKFKSAIFHPYLVSNGRSLWPCSQTWKFYTLYPPFLLYLWVKFFVSFLEMKSYMILNFKVFVKISQFSRNFQRKNEWNSYQI